MSRIAQYGVIGVGQSLLVRPTPLEQGGTGCIMDELQNRFPHVVMINRGIGGASWTELDGGTGDAAGRPASTWTHPYLLSCVNLCVLALGGTGDVAPPLFGEGDSAATVYANMWAFTESLKDVRTALGYSTYVIGCTITPASYITGGSDTNRTTANGLIIADGSNKFDAVVDLAGTSGLSSLTGTDSHGVDCYVTDVGGQKVHWSAAGMVVAADAVEPEINTFVPSNYR